ncbi:MAG: M48 family metalloprotease [Hyphomicrobiaceae bacterium]|nr:M48 family metalloprotease [Hyphomicrobiaceae bacterium]
MTLTSTTALPRSRPRQPRLRERLLAMVAGVAVLSASALPAKAQRLPEIRDTEIERLLRDYAQPILRVAGQASQNVAVRIIKNDSFNAFVIDGSNIFLNTGTLLISETPNQVIGVIAHETGHISNGHLARLRAKIRDDTTRSLIMKVLGIGALIVAGASGRDSAKEAAGGLGKSILYGTDDVLGRSILSYVRAQEQEADLAAFKFLHMTKQSARGMLETFERFANQEYLTDANKDPYVRSHPLATQRLAQLRDLAQRSRYFEVRDAPELQARHDLMRAKIAGFTEPPQVVLRRYPDSDQSLAARYARAIARNCQGRCARAIGEVDALIRERPRNPYFWELKGDLLYRQGRPHDAIPALRKALQLLGGDAPLIQVTLAQALLATNNPRATEEAYRLCLTAKERERHYAQAYFQLGAALYRMGREPESHWAAAEAHYYSGDFKEAKRFAKRAMVKLKRGSPYWSRANEIATMKQPKI